MGSTKSTWRGFINKTRPLLIVIGGSVSILLCLVLAIGCGLLYFVFNEGYTTTSADEQRAIELVQNWKLPGFVDMTCKDWIEITAFPYEKFGDAKTTWSASIEDEQGDFIVTARIYNQYSDVSFHWRVNLPSQAIIPMEAETLCPPRE